MRTDRIVKRFTLRVFITRSRLDGEKPDESEIRTKEDGQEEKKPEVRFSGGNLRFASLDAAEK